MTCERCDGIGVIVVQAGQRFGLTYALGHPLPPLVPCPDCLGARQLYCCDGLREQPDAEPA